MKKIVLLLFTACLLQFATAQVHTFKTIAFVDGGTVSSCSFAAQTFMFNGYNYTSFPGFGTTNTTSARGNHSHTGTYVTSVTATAPVVSTGGMTPVISMPISDEVTDGYLSKENFNIFFGRVKSVSAILPLQCSGGTEPELQILRASESENGYLSFKDFTTFNSKVSSQWIDGSGLIYLPSGKCGIGLTNPTYTLDVSGTTNINDFKSTGSYISRITAAAGNSVISGIWSDGTTPGPGGGNISNHSVYASAADGSYFYYYNNPPAYNYQVGIFDNTGERKAFIGKMGGSAPTQPYVNLGSANFPWGKGYYADSLHTKNIQIMGNIGIGTATMTNAINFEGSAAKKISVNQNTNTAVPGSSLTMEAGNCLNGYANKAGGNIIFNGGLGTGNSGSDAVFNLSQRAATGGGTTHNPLLEVARIAGNGSFSLNSNFIYQPQIMITGYNDASAPYINFRHAGGTMAIPTNVPSWSAMGNFIWQGRLRGVFTNTSNFGAVIVDSAMNTGSSFPSSMMTFSSTNKNGTQNNYYMNEVGYFGISPANTASLPTTFLDIVGDKIRLRTAKTIATSTTTGNQGDICWDATFIYVCVATNTWKRIAIATW